MLGIRPDERVTIQIVEDRYRELAKSRHPDRGGTDVLMAELNRARADARRELGDD